MEWTPDRIRLFRAVGLSLPQPKFAKELGFCKRTIGNAERGTHSPSLALRRALDQALEHASEAQRNRFLAAVAASSEDCADQSTKAHDVRYVASLPRANPRQFTAHLDDIAQRDETLVASAGSATSGWFGRGDLEAVREMASIFSRVDQRRGGGHARTALVAYLTSDVASYLQGNYTDKQVRKDMFSATSELAYLSGWMAFDNAEHSIAQHDFSVAVKLAEEADDPPMAGHVLRAMAHQAVDLGHLRQGLDLAAASMDGKRYLLASPRERALFGVVYARALGATGQGSAAAEALIKAENDLAAASTGDDEPSRVFFFGEASLAHETARTLLDTGDLSGARTEFQRSVRTRKATVFTRTHAVTLGYLGAGASRRDRPGVLHLVQRAGCHGRHPLRTHPPGRIGYARRIVALPQSRCLGDHRTRRTCLRLSEHRVTLAPNTRLITWEKESFMAGQSFEVEAIAQVIGGRIEPTDDYWGGARCIIRINSSRFGADATAGLDAFSHLEIVFRFHLTDPTDLNLGARRPRDNPNWPEVGIFGHRNMRRLNWLGVSRCRLIKVDDLDLHVEELDAVDGTPVLDIKPWFREFGPRGTVRQAPWSSEMLTKYFATPPPGS